jgi:sporulation protein YlmC with PRC-barrel domain
MKKIATIMAIVFAVCLFMTGQSIAEEEQVPGEVRESHDTEMQTYDEMQTSDEDKQVPGARQGGLRESADTEMQTSWMTGLGQSLQVSKLMDKEVQGQNQENLGSVSDLYVSQDGRIEYLLISRDDDMVPIPWDQVQQMDQEDALIVNITEQKFEDAPAFSEADFEQEEWRQEVRGYYGQEQQDLEMEGGQEAQDPLEMRQTDEETLGQEAQDDLEGEEEYRTIGD